MIERYTYDTTEKKMTGQGRTVYMDAPIERFQMKIIFTLIKIFKKKNHLTGTSQQTWRGYRFEPTYHFYTEQGWEQRENTGKRIIMHGGLRPAPRNLLIRYDDTDRD